MTKRKTLGTAVLAMGLIASLAVPALARPAMVTANTEIAIHKGLQFLAKTQNRRGSWAGGTGYGASYEAAMTGLAGVALLCSGSTPTRGPYNRNIYRAILWTLSQQKASGLICSMAEESRSMYGHGFSTLFLAEALGTTGNKQLEAKMRRALGRAIKLIEGSQSMPDKPYGGWIYTPSQNSDEGSVTVTQVQALRACQNAGVQVNRKVIDRAFRYLQECKTPDGGIAYSLRSGTRGSGRPALAAAAWTCLNSAGRYNDPLTVSVRNYCLKRWKSMLSQRSGHFYYTQLYLAEAMYQHGGKHWAEYYPKIRDWLLKNKVERGDGTYAWQGDSVGVVYGTSIAMTILQLPYGYFPVVQK
jgi:hypothetical protein